VAQGVYHCQQRCVRVRNTLRCGGLLRFDSPERSSQLLSKRVVNVYCRLCKFRNFSSWKLVSFSCASFVFCECECAVVVERASVLFAAGGVCVDVCGLCGSGGGVDRQARAVERGVELVVQLRVPVLRLRARGYHLQLHRLRVSCLVHYSGRFGSPPPGLATVAVRGETLSFLASG
jgi:hypothetical protein